MTDTQILERAVLGRRMIVRVTFFFCRECATMFTWHKEGKRAASHEAQMLAHMKRCALERSAQPAA